MSGTVKEQDKDIGAAWNELPRELRAAVLRELGIFDEYSQRQEWDLKPFEELPPIVQRWLKAYETAARERAKKS